METQELSTADEIASRLGIKPSTIRAWARQGRIPTHALSHKVIRYRLHEVIEALEASSRKRKGGRA
jgi:excisionase family DNA binding protein